MKTDDIKVWQKFVIGTVASIIEALVNHPFWEMKTRKQKGLPPVPEKWSALYNGVRANTTSMIPITALQMVSYDVIRSQLFADPESPVTKVVSAFAAGVGPSAIACPVEMVMTHQTPKVRFLATAQALIKHGGVQRLFTGGAATAWRDGIFTAGYMVLPEYIKAMLRPWFKTDASATFASRIVAGEIAAVASQVFDTVKTAQQSGEQTVREALKQPFKGGLFRNVRIVSAVYIMSTVKDNMNTFFKQRNEESAGFTPSRQNTRGRGFSG